MLATPTKILAAFAVVVVTCILSGSRASAVSTVRIDYLGGSTAGSIHPLFPSRIDANVGDILSFDVSVDVDAAGISNMAFLILWGEWKRSSLELVSANWETGSVVSRRDPTGILDYNVPSMMVADLSGEIRNLGWSTPFYPHLTTVSTSVFLGTFSFLVTDIRESRLNPGLGFEAGYAGQFAQDALLNSVTPNFEIRAASCPTCSAHSLVINNLPEPGSIVLLSLGLAGLKLTRRRVST